MPKVDANGIEIHYEREGEGEPLLMIMGLGAQLTDWPQGLIDEVVSRDFDVIRLDNRDAGLSTLIKKPIPKKTELVSARVLRRRIPVPYKLHDMAADSAGLLDALGIENAHVAGASMGGMISQSLAIHHPDRVRSLTSIMSTTGNQKVGRPRRDVLMHLARRPRSTRETFVKQGLELFEMVTGPLFDEEYYRRRLEESLERSFRPDGTARQAVSVLTTRDRTPALRNLDLPALVIHGMCDSLVTPSGGKATANAIPGARLLMFPDMGHGLPRARWPEIADGIRSVADKGNAKRARDAEVAA